MKTVNNFDFDQIKAHVQNRNAFDLSFSSLFTSPCGMILPVYCEEVLAGDYISLGCDSFTRTAPAVAPAFVNFDEKTDFYFVPYRLLWSLYDSWRLGTNIYNRSSLGNSFDYLNDGPVTLPSDLTLPSMFFGLLLQSLYNDTMQFNNDFGFRLALDFERMLDFLGFGCPYYYDSPDDEQYGSATALSDLEFKVNLMRPLAYQCIIQHYFRNTDFEPFLVDSFNVDHWTTLDSGFTFENAGKPDSHIFSWFRPDFKCFRKDRFNSVKPINGFGYNALEVVDQSLIDTLWSQNNVPSTSTDLNSSPDNSTSFGSSPFVRQLTSITGTTANNVLTPNDIRLLFANDAMLRSMVYSKKDYAHLREAILGISSQNFDVPEYLGTHSSMVTLSDVEATATTDKSTLGELAGKGVGGNSSFVFKQDFKEDGVIIGMHYIMPRNNYDATMFDRRNTVLSRYDMPMPQFDNLGLQPVWLWEYSTRGFMEGIATWLRGSGSGNVLNVGFGYESRYGQYKSRVNVIHGEFMQGNTLDYWTLSTNVENGSDEDKWKQGLLGDGFFKIRPNITDQVFNVAYDGTQKTDPFYCSMSFNVTRVSNLSVMGVPSVNNQI